MKFTVKEALELEVLKGSKVVAGMEGLDNELRFINVMEVPDISDWISGYEMILTTAYPYKDSDVEWIKFVEELKMKNLSAFAIKTERFIEQIPQEIIDTGNRLNIPIIQLPIGARFDLIIKDVMRQIINKDYTIIKMSQTIHERFSEIVLSGGELKEIAYTLSDITDHYVIVEDMNHEILAGSLGYKDIINENKEKLKEEKVSITIYGKTISYIKLISPDGKFSKEDIVALERARDAASMVFLKRKGKEDIEKKYKNDFLLDLIKGKIKSNETLIERGKFFNIDFSGSYILFLLDIESLDFMFSKEMKSKRLEGHDVLSELFNVVFNSFFSRSSRSIIWSMGKNIFVLYPVKRENNDKDNLVKDMSIELAKDMKEKVDKHIKEFDTSIGIGRYYKNILDIHKSYEEAKEALRVGKMIRGYNNIYHYDDIETYNILMRGSSTIQLKSFMEQKLGKLIEYDNKNNTELLTTLEILLDNDGNMKSTSDQMFLHHKTVLYRKNQIEEILGISLNNMEEKFSIYMALKIKQLI